MSGILDFVTQQLGGRGIQQLAGILGVDDRKTQMMLAAALPVLLAALAKNAKKQEGASALHGALQRDHDGSALNDLTAAFGRTDDGGKILGHILGGRQGRTESGVGRAAGVDSATASKLMAALAPVLMGALGKTQRQQNLDPNGLADLLQGQRRDVERQAPKQMGMLEKMLDSDDDGDVDLGDVAKAGMGLLGKFLK